MRRFKESVPGKDEAILALLAKLSLHYWRPDFTPSQAKQLYRDYIEDFSKFAVADIIKAIAEYRQDGANRFFPTSGQIIDLIIGKAEVDAKGYTDRFEALKWRRNAAMKRGMEEANEVCAKLAGEPSPALIERERRLREEPLRIEAPSRPLASDLPPHPMLTSKLPDQRGE